MLLSFYWIQWRAVSIETCYQSIATSLVISMFSGKDRTKAMSVPLFYGLTEAIVIWSFCIFAWRKGWTKASRDESLCNVLANSYEVEESIKENMHDDITLTEMTPPRSPDRRQPTVSSQEDFGGAALSVVEGIAPSPSMQANAHIDEALRTHNQGREELPSPSWIV